MEIYWFCFPFHSFLLRGVHGLGHTFYRYMTKWIWYFGIFLVCLKNWTGSSCRIANLGKMIITQSEFRGVFRQTQLWDKDSVQVPHYSWASHQSSLKLSHSVCRSDPQGRIANWTASAAIGISNALLFSRCAIGRGRSDPLWRISANLAEVTWLLGDVGGKAQPPHWCETHKTVHASRVLSTVNLVINASLPSQCQNS